jgi:zinc D-Ala-D-Ala carboxypeptidase
MLRLSVKGRVASIGAAAMLLSGVGLAVTPGAASASTCNNTATFSWKNNCTIGDGNASNMVISVQRIVSDYLGCPTLTIDGIDGPDTTAAVECFQSKMKITVDGIVGPQTWGKLQSTLTTAGCTQTSLTYEYYNSATPCWWRENVNTGVWGVVGLNGTFVTMNMSGPS